jgi:hypothetical protein
MSGGPGGELVSMVELGLQIVPEPGADVAELDRLSRLLRVEIDELDIDDLVPASVGGAPPGSKGVDLASVSEMIVTMSASGGVLASVVACVRDWLQRRVDAHRVTMTIKGDKIELTRASDDERAALVAAFVARHSK